MPALRSTLILIAFICLFATSIPPSLFLHNFTLTFQSIFPSVTLTSMIWNFPIGQAKPSDELYFSLKAIDANGLSRNLSEDYCVYLVNSNGNYAVGDYYGEPSMLATVPLPDFYGLRVNKYITKEYFSEQMTFSRYLVVVSKSGSTRQFISVLSYQFEKLIKFNSGQTVTFSLRSPTLLNEQVNLYQMSNSSKYVYSALQNKTFTRISSSQYNFTFSVPPGYYVLRMINSQTGINYSLTYFSDPYPCDFPPQFVDNFLIFQPCIHPCNISFFFSDSICLSCSLANQTQCGSGQCLNFAWISSSCRNCDLIANTVSKNHNILKECSCEGDYLWNNTISTCLSCQLNEGICNNCLHSFWNNNKCIRCSLILYTKATLDIIVSSKGTKSCLCQDSYYWNPDTFRCQQDCSQFTSITCAADYCPNSYFHAPFCTLCTTFNNTSPKNGWNFTSLQTQCLCLSHYVWTDLSGCVFDCPLFNSSSCGNQTHCLEFAWDGNICTNTTIKSGGVNSSDASSGGVIGLIIGIVLSAIVVVILVCKRQQMSKCFKNVDEQAYMNNEDDDPTRDHFQPFPNDQCPICLANQTTLILDCNHMLHISCYLNWKVLRSSCPLCIRPDNEKYRIICEGCRIYHRRVNKANLDSLPIMQIVCQQSHFPIKPSEKTKSENSIIQS